MTGSPAGIRIALIEDHEVVGVGLRELIQSEKNWYLESVVKSVADLDLTKTDLALLDLRLNDGSSPGENVAILLASGIPVLAYTAGEDAALLRMAAKAGILGVVRKSDDVEVLIEAIRRALRGETAVTADWAAAIDGDLSIADARLSPRESEVLALYASGETAMAVAQIMGLSPDTVSNYVGRIRTKYALAGRTATTKVDLHMRAREDGLLRPTIPVSHNDDD